MCAAVHSHVCTWGQRKTLGSLFKSHIPLFKTSRSLACLVLSDLPRLAPIATPHSLPRTMITRVLHCTGSFHVGSVDEIRSLCSCSNSVKPELSP